jgi:hypothetical protein
MRVFDERGDSFAGVVEEICGPGGLIVACSDREQRVELVPAAGAQIDRNGAARLVDFAAGDEVFADGAWRDGRFVATSLVILDSIGGGS